jgi:uncharacterized damage-inducible protein DinB
MTDDLVSAVKTAYVAEIEAQRDAIRQAVTPLSDAQLWQKPLDPGNSAGHLILHLTGNLNHFVGAQLGKTGYLRDREREFTEANPPARDEVMRNFDAAVAMFRRVVDSLTPEHLAAPHPEARFGPVVKALVHLTAHFALHRGQISYIVRLVK